MPEQTINRPAAPAGSAASAENNGGSTTPQPGGEGQVETQTPEANGNSAAGGASGSDGGAGDRQRAPRSERRIHELTTELSKVQDENAVLKDMLAQKPDYSGVTVPELKDGEDITPEKYKSDVISAADQIVQLRMNQLVPKLTENITRPQANARTLDEIQAAVKDHPELDENSADYDEDLAGMLVSTFRDARKGNPNYSFRALVNETFKLRDKVAKRISANQTDQNDNRANGAIRPKNNPKTAAKSEDSMSAAEYAKAHGLSF